ncbi:hypothetical protein CRE_24615 [Caenorhabditis remanei]|uniref:Uncharacterized protein n=1 Tax=Caenorhabditis remanei TaxID=31234 RepID=E3MVG3_CAERE|nr:hypothetical protein CRE_24615 [Caenorhabditis remanei]
MLLSIFQSSNEIPFVPFLISTEFIWILWFLTTAVNLSDCIYSIVLCVLIGYKLIDSLESQGVTEEEIFPVDYYKEQIEYTFYCLINIGYIIHLVQNTCLLQAFIRFNMKFEYYIGTIVCVAITSFTRYACIAKYQYFVNSHKLSCFTHLELGQVRFHRNPFRNWEGVIKRERNGEWVIDESS